MGIETYLISSTVNLVVGQRLVRIICPDCRQAVEESPDMEAEFRRVLTGIKEFDVNEFIQRSQQKLSQENPSLQPAPNQLYLYKPVGCSKCNNSGFTGRIGIYEVLKVDEKVSQMVLQHASEAEIEKVAKEGGMITMIQDGYIKVLDGLTTIEEVLRVAKD